MSTGDRNLNEEGLSAVSPLSASFGALESVGVQWQTLLLLSHCHRTRRNQQAVGFFNGSKQSNLRMVTHSADGIGTLIRGQKWFLKRSLCRQTRSRFKSHRYRRDASAKHCCSSQ